MSVRTKSPANELVQPHPVQYEDQLRPFLDRRINSYYYLLNSPDRAKSLSNSRRPLNSPFPDPAQKVSNLNLSPQKSDLMTTAGTKFQNKSKPQSPEKKVQKSCENKELTINQLQDQNKVYLNLFNKEVKRHEQEKKTWIEQGENIVNELRLKKSNVIEQLLLENSELKQRLDQCKTSSERTIFGLNKKIKQLTDLKSGNI